MSRPIPLEERFWPKVDRTETCWLWIGARNPRGYGIVRVSSARPTVLAHRASWELTNGPIPLDLCVLHRCDVPACVRPEHLFLGTRHDNMQDCMAKGRYVARKIRNKAQGDTHGQAKLRTADVLAIRERFANGERQYLLATEYGISKPTLHDIVHRVTWTHV